MLVVCYGVTKSGSTLAFELAKRALANSGHSQARLSDQALGTKHNINFIDSISPDRIKAMEAEVGPDSLVAIKTHTGLDRRNFRYIDDLCAQGHLKVQVVYRDPRDVCLSMIDAGMRARAAGHGAFSEIRDMADAVQAVERQLGKLRRWGALTNALIVGYEDVAFNTEAALTQIESHLGVSSDHEAVIDEVMNKAFTQKNKAVPARHRTELNDADRKLLDLVFGPFLRRVCARKDYTWFTDVRRSLLRKEEAVGRADA
jgi:hypothetical protein